MCFSIFKFSLGFLGEKELNQCFGESMWIALLDSECLREI